MSDLRATGPRQRWITDLLRSQQFAFLLIGAANFAIGMGWFTVFHLLLDQWISYMVTLLLTYAAAIPCAFVLYRTFVFKVRGNVLVDLMRFTLVQMASLGINAAALPLFVSVLGLPVLAGQFLALCCVVVFNYFGHLLFSFRRHPVEGSSG